MFEGQTSQSVSVVRGLRLIVTLANSVYVWWAVCLVAEAIYAWTDRHSMNPDGMSYFDMADKLARMKAGTPENPFIDPAGYGQFIDASEARFQKLLGEEKHR